MKKFQDIIAADERPPAQAAGLRIARNLLQTAENRKNAGDYDSAVETFELYINEFGANAPALKSLASCLLHQGRIEEGIARYHQALAFDDCDPEPWIGLGTAEFQKANYGVAKHYFLSAVERAPDNDRAIAGLGVVSWQEGNGQDAREYFVRALDLRPENISALYFLLQQSYQTSEFTEIERRLGSYLEKRPNDAYMLFSLAGVQMMRGDNTAALETIRAVKSIDPNFEGAADFQAEIEKRLGNSEMAAS